MCSSAAKKSPINALFPPVRSDFDKNYSSIALLNKKKGGGGNIFVTKCLILDLNLSRTK